MMSNNYFMQQPSQFQSSQPQRPQSQTPQVQQNDLIRTLLNQVVQRLESHEQEINALRQEVNSLKKIVQLSRDQRNAQIKEKEMTLQDPLLKIYQNNLYQLLDAFFDSHRVLLTGLIARDMSGKVGTTEKVVKTLSSFAKMITEDIPLVNKLTKGLNYAITKGYDFSNKKESEGETNAVCLYLTLNKDPSGHLEEDVGLNCFAASVELALANSQKLLSLCRSEKFVFFSKNPLREKLWDSVSNEYSKIISQYKPGEEQRACILALEDAILVMVEIYLGWKTLIVSDESMEAQLFSLVMKHY